MQPSLSWYSAVGPIHKGFMTALFHVPVALLAQSILHANVRLVPAVKIYTIQKRKTQMVDFIALRSTNIMIGD